MTKPCASNHKFYADAMLGALAKWMRILGYDVEYERDIEDTVLVKRSLAEGRLVLTRDKLLLKRRSVAGRSFFVESDHVREQLRQVASRFSPPSDGFLTRCVRCNRALEPVAKSEVAALVPEYVFDTQETFARCSGCSRIYWAGTHKERMAEELAGIIEAEGDDG